MIDQFVIHECCNAECRLRFPLNPVNYSGKYCPKCGSPAILVEQVDQYVMMPPNSNNSPRRVAAILDNLRSDFNVGSAFRTANGAGIEHLYLCGITPRPDQNPRIAKTALGAESMLPWTYHPNAVILAKALKDQGAYLVALEATPNAKNLFEFDCSHLSSKSIILIVGSELAGVDPGLLGLADTTLFISMHGEKGSLNVSVAFGVAAYYLTSQRL